MLRAPSNRIVRLTLIGATAVLLGGCGADQSLLLSGGPSPRVEDCMVLQQATPTRFVCNGKTYTSIQLSDIRLGKATLTK